MAPITNYMKKIQFVLTKTTIKVFPKIKKRLTEAQVLQIPYILKVFEVAYGASNVGIWGILSQKEHPIAFFSEKLNETKQKYYVNDKELHAMVQALRYFGVIISHIRSLFYFHIMKHSSTSTLKRK